MTGDRALYKCIDKVLSPELQSHYSWAGINKKGQPPKKQFKGFQNTTRFLFQICQKADPTYGWNAFETKMKNNVLPHAARRNKNDDDIKRASAPKIRINQSVKRNEDIDVSINENHEEVEKSLPIDSESSPLAGNDMNLSEFLANNSIELSQLLDGGAVIVNEDGSQQQLLPDDIAKLLENNSVSVEFECSPEKAENPIEPTYIGNEQRLVNSTAPNGNENVQQAIATEPTNSSNTANEQPSTINATAPNGQQIIQQPITTTNPADNLNEPEQRPIDSNARNNNNLSQSVSVLSPVLAYCNLWTEIKRFFSRAVYFQNEIIPRVPTKAFRKEVIRCVASTLHSASIRAAAKRKSKSTKEFAEEDRTVTECDDEEAHSGGKKKQLMHTKKKKWIYHCMKFIFRKK